MEIIYLIIAILFAIGGITLLVSIKKALKIAKDIDLYEEERKEAARRIVNCLETYLREHGNNFDSTDAKALVITIKQIFLI